MRQESIAGKPLAQRRCSDCGAGLFHSPELVRYEGTVREDRYRKLRYGCTCDGSPPLPEGWTPVPADPPQETSPAGRGEDPTGSPVSVALRRAVRKSPVSCYSIAKQTDIAESVLSRFINGKAGISIGTLDRLASAVGCVLVSASDAGAERNPFVVAAAVKRTDGLICSLPRPARHHDIIHALADSGWPQREGDEQGFLLSNGQFADRNEAARLAVEAGQIAAPKWPPGLFSEDLW